MTSGKIPGSSLPPLVEIIGGGRGRFHNSTITISTPGRQALLVDGVVDSDFSGLVIRNCAAPDFDRELMLRQPSLSSEQRAKIVKLIESQKGNVDGLSVILRFLSREMSLSAPVTFGLIQLARNCGFIS